MNNSTMRSAVPMLASLDIPTSVDFYTGKLGFACRVHLPGEYAILHRDAIELHFWPCPDPDIAANTACRVSVAGIQALFNEYTAQGVIRPDCTLRETPWHTREFEVFDPHNNLVTFFERVTNIS